MQITMVPVPGSEVAKLRIEDACFSLNDVQFFWDSLPESGPVRLESGTVIVEYGEEGGVATCQLTDAHAVWIIQPDLPPPPPTVVDPVAAARADLEAQRATWVAQRWQLIAVLGEARWQAITAFAAGDLSTWGMKAAIDYAVDIPRNSQTVDLLAFILGLSETEADDIFRQAMALFA